MMSNESGTVKVMDTTSLSDSDLQKTAFVYAKQLAGKDLLPVIKNGQPLPGRWTATVDDGTIIHLRSISTNLCSRWSVVVINADRFIPLVNQKAVEIKFK
jgi:hypothetical protein